MYNGNTAWWSTLYCSAFIVSCSSGLMISQMGLRPIDLIATLPQMHEKSTTPLSQLPSSPPPLDTPPPDTPPDTPPPHTPPAVPKDVKRERSVTEGDVLMSKQSKRLHSGTNPPHPKSPSLGAKLAKKLKKTPRNQLNDAEEYIHSRVDTKMLRHDHYSSLEVAAKCRDKNCRKRFGWRDRKRNCCMCGEVFCRKCTKYFRKLSHNAEPDPLGTFRNVCETCFNFNPSSGRYRNRKYEFDEFRKEVRRKQLSKQAADSETPLPARTRSKSKSDQIHVELDRLVNGFENQVNGLKGLVTVGTPSWQKSANWVPDSQASNCFKCQKRFRLRKINCRVCGQVFCSNCTQSEILLYCFKNTPAKWAINGKEGGPSSKPSRFELHKICDHCCSELEEILLSDICGSPLDDLVQPFQPNCLDEMATLQAELAGLQKNVEQCLPKYQQLVDTLGIEDSSPRAVEGDHPLQKLAKTQADLSDTFTYMANRSQALKNLRLNTETQVQLHNHIMMATFNFYQEHMFLFKSTQMKLKEMVPIESLDMIQGCIDQQSMERVHVSIRQLSYELLNLQDVYKCELEFTRYLGQADNAIEEEFRPFLEKRGESWEEHLKHVGDYIGSAMKDRPFIKLSKNLPRSGKQVKPYIRYITLDRTKSVILKCVRELDVKTRDEMFLKTKSSLATAGKNVTKELNTITDKLSPK